jgi:hypothetical protein
MELSNFGKDLLEGIIKTKVPEAFEHCKEDLIDDIEAELRDKITLMCEAALPPIEAHMIITKAVGCIDIRLITK